ncbi:5'-methylthioadenosine/S-adenosylhomocysteine nucleosidase family protein [Streptomyces sp. JNUCC 64]
MTEPRVGVIVPLAEEFAYVSSVLDVLGDMEVDDRVYHRFVVPDSDGVTGVLTVVHDMGQASAALAAHDLAATFPVPLITVLGTAAALDEDVALGDVVIGSELIDYLNAGKVTEDPDDPTRVRIAVGGTHWKPSAPLLRYVRNFPIRKASGPLAKRWSADAHERCRIVPGSRPAKAPAYHVGHIASGDVVVASDAFKALIKNHDRKCLAVEMEAGGAALSAYQNDDADLMVIRGVSDYAEGNKTATDRTLDVDGEPNAWRRYAVENATALLATLLAGPGFPWRAAPNASARRGGRASRGAAERASGAPAEGNPSAAGLWLPVATTGALTAAATAAAVARHGHQDAHDSAGPGHEPTPTGGHHHGHHHGHRGHHDHGYDDPYEGSSHDSGTEGA